MDINVKSPFFLVQALAPLLKKNASAENTASIINIGSIAGIVGNALDNFSYAVSPRQPSISSRAYSQRNLPKIISALTPSHPAAFIQK